MALASQTGLVYARLNGAGALLRAFEAVARPRSVVVATDIRPYPAALALLLLVILYGFLPLRERVAGRSAPSRTELKGAHP